MTTTLILNNGVEIPALGFGVFQTPPDETTAAVETALRVGYRHIDTAAAYDNERGVGEPIRRRGVDRDDVFIETKVWISDYGYDETLHAFDKSAGKLGVDQIDLLILHQALPSRFDLTIDAYKALETLLADGKVRAIGVSNFMPDHLDQLLAATTVIPAVNQVEVHPYFRQPDVLAADHAHGILTQAWSPIGGITFYRPGHHSSTLQDPTITEIAAAHGKTAAQTMCVGTCSRAGRPFPSRPIRPASPRTTTSSTSSSPPTTSPESTRSTPASVAAPNQTRSPSTRSARPSPRRNRNSNPPRSCARTALTTRLTATLAATS
jgi:2,5-diketo-D-gluconate reductase A